MTLSTAYPRDLIGYGRNPPQANWPGKAQIALQFVLNYEEGGENCVLHADAGSEQQRDLVWITTRAAIARHWMKAHPWSQAQGR